MDNPLAVGRRVEVHPANNGLARHYDGHVGFIAEVQEAAGLYVVSFARDEWHDVRVVLTAGEVDPV